MTFEKEEGKDMTFEEHKDKYDYSLERIYYKFFINFFNKHFQNII